MKLGSHGTRDRNSAFKNSGITWKGWLLRLSASVGAAMVIATPGFILYMTYFRWRKPNEEGGSLYQRLKSTFGLRPDTAGDIEKRLKHYEEIQEQINKRKDNPSQ